MGDIDMAELPPGQRRVCEKMLDSHCYRYVDVATALRISPGTVRRHLARVRANHPAVYKQMMAQRRRHLDDRHDRAEAREQNRRGWLLPLFERRVNGYQVGVDLDSMFAAMSYYELDEDEVKRMVDIRVEPLPAGGVLELEPLPETVFEAVVPMDDSLLPE